jgi:hypothetical protein
VQVDGLPTRRLVKVKARVSANINVVFFFFAKFLQMHFVIQLSQTDKLLVVFNYWLVKSFQRLLAKDDCFANERDNLDFLARLS